jgi:ubiquitin carboxyl-terminal hydrolase 7
VYNISKDLSNPSQFYAYDEPMLLRTREGETLGEVKARIKTKLEATDEDFAKWKFHIGQPPRYQILEDDDLILSSKLMRMAKEGFCETTLGIEREIRGPRRPASRQGKSGGFERAIKIM